MKFNSEEDLGTQITKTFLPENEKRLPENFRNLVPHERKKPRRNSQTLPLTITTVILPTQSEQPNTDS